MATVLEASSSPAPLPRLDLSTVQDLRKALRINKYFKEFPTPKQAAFLMLRQEEAFFGGAGGPGKSSALLMGALQDVHIPGYAALILRRSYTDLALPGALMDRAHDWLDDTDAHWDGIAHTWTFPSTATLSFGYLENEKTKQRYRSAELTYIAFDELTQFTETQYLFLFSRLRRKQGFPVNLRMRSASNPGDTGHCVPYGDVLTPSGWKDIRTFLVGDPVYTVAPDGTLVETHVAQVHQSSYTGDMIVAQTRNLHLACTPNHRIAKVGGVRAGLHTRGGATQRFALVPFAALPGQATVLRTVRWDAPSLPAFTPPPIPTRRRKHQQPVTLSGRHFAALLGWMLAEGCCVDRDKAFCIAQYKPDHRETIATLLSQAGFTFSTTAVGFTVYAPDWWAYFRDFGHSREKYIPTWVKMGSRADLAALFTALMDGDGHWQIRQKVGQYYTASAQLADDVAEVAFKLGYVVYSTHRQRDNRVGRSYAVNISSPSAGGTELLTGNHCYEVTSTTRRRSDIQYVPFTGEVYCLGIPDTQTFVLRQHGAVWVSGNSWVRERFIDTGAANNRPFIPARLRDNPHLDIEAYRRSLSHLDPITRLQIEEGDWDALGEGELFKRHWFKIVEDWPRGIRLVRFWDLAATEDMAGTDPDWTAGALVGFREGQYWLLDMRHARLSPKGVEDLIAQTAALDGRKVDIWIEQEPGSSGKAVIDHYQRQVLPGYTVRGLLPSGPKTERARPVSSAAEAGNVFMLHGPWNRALLDELVLFPIGLHDDQVDAISGAVSVCNVRKGRVSFV
jgi:predicted phage terminase large subunit-like protein